MASRSEIKRELKTALSEIGTIVPWYDKRYKMWVFSNDLYPVECEGNSAAEVKKKYPKYLEVFLEHRMKGKLDLCNEKKTKGRGGLRAGAGRPVGSTKEPTKQIRVPIDIADWLKQPNTIPHLRDIMRAYKHAV